MRGMRGYKQYLKITLWTLAVFYIGFQCGGGNNAAHHKKHKSTKPKHDSGSSIKQFTLYTHENKLIEEHDKDPNIKQFALYTHENELLEERKIHHFAPNPPRIVYNRVPKCGSTTVLTVINNLAERNNFTHIHSHEYHQHTIDDDDQEALMGDLGSWQAPWLYDRHLAFLDFERFESNAYRSPPQYINLFRDPLERWISRFYYHNMRHGVMKNVTFNECVRKYVPHRTEKCITSAASTLQYFCGNEEYCGESSDDALAQAMQNIERHYKVLGVIKDVDSFFKLLEHHFPTMFKGAFEVYLQTQPKNVDPLKRPKESEANDETKEKMADLLKYEFMLYEFILQKLDRDKRDAGIV